MQFINRQKPLNGLTKVKTLGLAKRLLLAFSLTLFSACSFLGGNGALEESTDTKQNTPAEQGVNPDATPAVQPPAPVIPKENPYLTNRPPASAADQKLFAQALSAAKAEQWEQASALFQALTQQNPALSGPYLNLGVIAQKQDQLEQAEIWFKKAIEVNKNNLDAYTALALLYKDQAKFTEAKEQLTQAVTLWPLYPAGHRNLGILNEFYLGDFKAALKHYKTYQSLLAEPDRKVKGWIIDLERRIPPDPEEQKAEAAEPTDSTAQSTDSNASVDQQNSPQTEQDALEQVEENSEQVKENEQGESSEQVDASEQNQTPDAQNSEAVEGTPADAEVSDDNE